MVISDYHRAFCAAFGRDDVTPANLNAYRKRMNWTVGPRKGRTAGRLRKFSGEEKAWLHANCTLPTGEYHAAFVGKFGRQDVTASMLFQLRKRQQWKTGRTGRFVKGQTSHNAGQKCAEGVGGRHPNARRTHFKKGQTPHNAVPLGAERLSKDGYVEISVAERNPHTGAPHRYVHKHVWLWRQANGPVPSGHCLKCLDGNKLNTDPANWEAIPRAVLARLNGGRFRRSLAYDAAPAELKPTVMAVAKLKHRATEVAQRESRT